MLASNLQTLSLCQLLHHGTSSYLSQRQVQQQRDGEEDRAHGDGSQLAANLEQFPASAIGRRRRRRLLK